MKEIIDINDKNLKPNRFSNNQTKTTLYSLHLYAKKGANNRGKYRVIGVGPAHSARPPAAGVGVVGAH